MLKSSIDYLRLRYILSVPDIHVGVASKFEVYSGHAVPQNAAANFSKCATLGCKIKPFFEGMQYIQHSL